MGIEIQDTTPIPIKVPISPQWMNMGNLCRITKSEDTTGYFSFPFIIPTDESFSLECSKPSTGEINIAEAYALCRYHFNNRHTGTLLLDWANAIETDQISRPILMGSGNQIQIQREWLSIYYEDYVRHKLELNYLMIDREELIAFLKKNILFTDFLDKLKEEIVDIFGADVKSLSLEYIMDMEEGLEGITVLIHTLLPLERSFVLLNDFDEKYWLNKDYAIRKYISVMVAPE
jgi:hypothetical protein